MDLVERWTSQSSYLDNRFLAFSLYTCIHVKSLQRLLKSSCVLYILMFVFLLSFSSRCFLMSVVISFLTSDLFGSMLLTFHVFGFLKIIYLLLVSSCISLYSELHRISHCRGLRTCGQCWEMPWVCAGGRAFCGCWVHGSTRVFQITVINCHLQDFWFIGFVHIYWFCVWDEM